MCAIFARHWNELHKVVHTCRVSDLGNGFGDSGFGFLLEGFGSRVSVLGIRLGPSWKGFGDSGYGIRVSVLGFLLKILPGRV